MAKQHWRGGALLAPVPPVLVSCGTAEKPNALTIGWSGIINTIPPKTYISVRPERFSYNLIKDSGEFVINLAPDKLAKCGLTVEPAVNLSAPAIAQCPINLECKVTDVIPLGTHHMFIADIVGVNVDESLLDKNGRLDMSKAHLLAYAHGEYFSLGKKLGSFGYSVKKKKHPTRGEKYKRRK